MEKYSGWVPQEPDESVRRFAHEKIRKNYIVFKTEWVDQTQYTDMLADETRKVKMARCACSACGTEFYADLIRESDPKHGFIDPSDGDPIYDKNTFLCPYCGEEVESIHTSRFGGRKTVFAGQTRILQILKNGEKVAFVVWYAEKQVDKWGTVLIRIERWAAYLPDGKKMIKLTGQQRCFQSYTVFERWYELKRCDICDINNFDVMPFDAHFLDGTEFENAKIDLLCKTENPAVIAYARTYQRWKNVENLITSGCGELFSDYAKRSSEHYNCYNCSSFFVFSTKNLRDVFDFQKVKPHEMIGVTKAELRELKKAGLTFKLLKNYRQLKEIDGRFTVELAKKVDRPDIIERISRYVDPIKAVRYLTKNGGNRNDYLYLDYLQSRRRARLPLETQIDLFPRDLQRKHDEAVKTMNAIKKKEKAELFQKAFEEWMARFSQTAYKADGLCVFICPTAEDMQAEGKTLHHCVASYIEPHAEGESFIFFVRRARRPERSYYTLNIEITDGKAEEIQLHGYKNDAKRKIPPEVRAFVDRWKREILIPFCQKENRRKTA